MPRNNYSQHRNQKAIDATSKAARFNCVVLTFPARQLKWLRKDGWMYIPAISASTLQA
jgi:hypothetical protein